jgi:hypothetical protein
MLDENLNALEIHGEARPQAPVNPGTRVLRRAIRRNIVSFPSQIPSLSKQPPDGMQWRMVLLFFIHGWSLGDVAARFKVPKHRVSQILNCWSVRALALGYVEVIDPEAFAKCCRVDVGFPESAPAVCAPAAIAHCEEWSGEFQVRATTRLRDLGAATERAFQRGRSNLMHELDPREEEHVSNAVT